MLVFVAAVPLSAFADEVEGEEIAVPEPTPPTAEYMGDAVCAACHGDLLDDYGQTMHAKVFTEGNARNEWMRRGCEGCHGPASLHVTGGGAKGVEGFMHLRADGTETPAEQNAACMQCHEGGGRLYWEASVHDSADVSCSSCHSVMKNHSREGLLSARTELETCSSCHSIQRSQMFRNAHMPVREEKMACGSCHNPHGTIADSLISAHTVNDNCYSCHAEKRGPFLWEHQPVYEDCVNCHLPHGSTRASMLKLSLPRLCQQCHPTGHAGNARRPADRFVIGSSCLQCHPAVHGSNHPSGNRFTR